MSAYHLCRRAVGVLLCLLCLCFLTAVRADVVISEVMAKNGTWESGHAYDWIELHNTGSKTVDLSGWHLTDNAEKPDKFTFPSGTKLKKGKYLTVFCTGEKDQSAGKGDTFYASFKLSASGETLLLSDAAGNAVQVLAIPAQYGNVSYGLPAGGTEYGYLPEITRGGKNSAQACSARADAPAINTTGGFYDAAVTVTAAGPEGCTLRYTTDGSTPTAKSKAFPADGLRVKKTTVLRVRAFGDDLVPSVTVSASYFIGDEQLTPVVSLITDEKYLFNKKTGALVKGTGAIPNYSKGFEYPVNIEYYNMDGVSEINQMGTFTCSGHSARINAQKSIALYARDALGPDSFAFNPFPTRSYTQYHSLLLRAANSDAYATRIRDIVASSLAEGQDILYQDHQIIQVYINGEYWGHYNLREKINKYFVAAYEGVTDKADIDAIDIIARTGTEEFTQNGSGEDWRELADFCRKKDLNDPENLRWVTDRLDVDSLFTHAAYEIILGNVDITNVRLYRIPGGKWKYLLFDVEACWRNMDVTPIEYYIKSVKGKINGFRHEPLNALLKVPEMKARFLTRVSDILRSSFRWPDVKARFDQTLSVMEQILPRHIKRWKNMKLSNWKKNISAIEYYARVRPKKIPSMLQSAMKLTDDEVEQYFGETLRILEQTNTK